MDEVEDQGEEAVAVFGLGVHASVCGCMCDRCTAAT